MRAADAAVTIVQPQTNPSAAYAFALVGGCARMEVPLLAANDMLQATRPVFPVVAMVTAACWSGPTVRRMVQAHVQPISIEDVRPEQVNCTGKFRGIPQHFVRTYAIFKVFGLTQYAAILYLDTDLAVLFNLDHLLYGLLAASHERAQIWTPQECKMLSGFQKYAFNTGVWGVRPNINVSREIVEFVASGHHRCHIGFQAAATQFFGNNHWSGHAHKLHVRYNLKPDHGFRTCMLKRGINASEVGIVHWSGWRKPWYLYGPYNSELLAYRGYMRSYCTWDRAFNTNWNLSVSSKTGQDRMTICNPHHPHHEKFLTILNRGKGAGKAVSTARTRAQR